MWPWHVADESRELHHRVVIYTCDWLGRHVNGSVRRWQGVYHAACARLGSLMTGAVGLHTGCDMRGVAGGWWLC